MRHPYTRAERRRASLIARLRYRNRLSLFSRLWSELSKTNLYWNRGGKQCEAHGNRCAHSMIDRHERRRTLKQLRRRLNEEDKNARY